MSLLSSLSNSDLLSEGIEACTRGAKAFPYFKSSIACDEINICLSKVISGVRLTTVSDILIKLPGDFFCYDNWLMSCGKVP